IERIEFGSELPNDAEVGLSELSRSVIPPPSVDLTSTLTDNGPDPVPKSGTELVVQSPPRQMSIVALASAALPRFARWTPGATDALISSGYEMVAVKSGVKLEPVRLLSGVEELGSVSEPEPQKATDAGAPHCVVWATSTVASSRPRFRFACRDVRAA